MGFSDTADDGAITARALYYEAPFSASSRTVKVPILTEDDRAKAKALVRNIYSGLSRGTERLIFEGRLPESEWLRMRAPFQTGDFPFPVKYGYASVGVVEDGPDALIGRTVFTLYPHQTAFTIMAEAAFLLPQSIPPRRAVLAANMETALNALWDSEAKVGQTIAVIGAGLVGCLIAHLARRLPGAKVTLIDINPERRSISETLGLDFCLSEEAEGGANIIFHTTASEAGLRLALELAAFEARIVEVSWFGDRQVSLPLGGAFHSQRLQIVSSQVGSVAKPVRECFSHRTRLETAISLLNDERLDSLITEEVGFEELPEALPRLLANDAPGIATAVRY
jgi:NADPH:quinone reductase-like Zn-dependent oxidoreductase